MARLPSPAQHSFAQVPSINIPRSTFNRSHGHKSTFDAGYLVPIYVDEALPGDTFNCNLTAFARLATPIKPLMDNMYLDTFFFAVPIRLVWDNFKKFMGEQTNPGDSISYTVPTMTSPGGGYAAQSLHDYLGLPINVASLTHSSLFHRCYNLIWNEWFRDQNLQNSVVVDKDDGPDTPGDYVLLRRGKRHDYFTSCLPWPQKGTAVSLPLGTTAPVVFPTAFATYTPNITRADTSASLGQMWGADRSAATGSLVHELGTGSAGGGAVKISGPALPSDAYANLASATAATINQLRQSFQIQRLLERDARAGTRYIEIIKSHFGVTSPDYRVQRPEYLGGSSNPVSIHPIAQTSSTDVTTPQGNLSAMGTAHIQGNGFVKSFTEHCIIIGLVAARADLTYQQGLPRMFSRSTRYDFYWPELSQIGEQAVLNKEIYCDASANDNNVFGYQERYAEYRYKPSSISGIFRSQYATPLDTWHLAQEFGALPTLNSTFIQDDPPIDRVIAVPSEPHFIYDSYVKLICARPMPLFGIPGNIDRL